MTLDELELDALIEIFNLGVGQAAHALSQIAGEEVLLSVPQVTMESKLQVAAQMDAQGCHRLCAVRQSFDGLFASDAMLMFPVDQSLLLVQMMVGSDIPLEQLSEMEQEALAEVGNILLNAVVGSMADLLKVQFEVSLPQVELGSPSDVLCADQDLDGRVLNLQIDFEIASREILGYLIFMLDIDSTELLKRRLVTFIQGELG